MKKKIIILVLLLMVIGTVIYFTMDKNNYNPIVDYESVNWDNMTKTNIDLTNLSSGDGYTVKNNMVTIKSGGCYYLSGEFNGQIIVDSSDEVYLALNGVDINYKESPIIIKNATKVVINLLGDNTLSDSDYNEETDATIYSADDLVIMGEGNLKIVAKNHGIKSKNNLQIISGNIDITAVNDGIVGKDSLAIKSGNIIINSSSDAIKITNEDSGYIIIDGGVFNLTSSGDAINASTSLTINDGTFNITTGNGSTLTSTNSSWGNWGGDTSSKGLKGIDITINNGTFNIDSSDDSIHSNGILNIINGDFQIKSGDDGIHADESLIIENGTINITKSYEGIESKEITINNGNISVVASDDGINAASGNDLSSMNRPGANPMSSGSGSVIINGGTIYINASGDGLDSNGSVKITSGTVVVNGPLDNGNGALDYDTTFTMIGGIMVASGSSGMVQNISTNSTQLGVSITFNETIKSGELISIFDGDNEIFTYSASKNYQNVVICIPEFTKTTYTIYTGGVSGNNKNGIYELGNYTNGTKYTTFTISNITTSVGNMNNGNGMPPRR